MSKKNSQYKTNLRNDIIVNHKPRWKQWVDANAKPKVLTIHKASPMPTRFRKPGPMREEDWERFHKWINQSMTKKCLPNDQATKSRKKRSQRKPLQERLNELALPKNKCEKYNSSSPHVYTFKPITNSSRKTVIHSSKCVRVPKWWNHEESEMSFWRDMRFPISYRAFQYQISNRIEDLAKPKKFPIKPHCPVPEPPVFEPIERVQMTKQQWKEHLRRLEYLSDSNFKTTRVEKVLEKMKPEINNKVKLASSYGLRVHSYAKDLDEV
ncbi:uncharacterized protein LOC129913207 [Episyrphus balteatus]|uniref:uncharacterized protein LOC129913207 n=1 Tax=Episyrphus balteatus TaxID=286459 RepID=UPI0024863747|nr:uncharacterized protein LOC129913207 [Episyrphus balteatus]